jgi:hypothetical protein
MQALVRLPVATRISLLRPCFALLRLACLVAWPLAGLAAATPGAAAAAASVLRPAEAGPLDQRVLSRLDALGLEPAPPCSDAVFLRRVSLDLTGTLPTALEAEQFLEDRSPNKRRGLVEKLLESEAFTDYWTMRWCDLLRVKAEFPINLWPNAAQAYHRWIRTSIHDGLPYDRFARALLTSSGSNFRSPAVNFYRASQSRVPQAIAQTVALTFMGERTESWPSNRLAGMAAFFSTVGYKQTGEWKEEIVLHDPLMATNQLWRMAAFPDGTPAALDPDQDPREVFADWLLQPANPCFTRAIANRVWAWLMGRGIIHEPDDLRPGNAPSNPELLAWLEAELIESRYDLKHLFRIIVLSRTYQQSSVPGAERPESMAHFACYPTRRLEAEVLIDAINQVTDTREKYSSPIPEPFTFIPDDQRAIALPDGSITSPFLELFGRSPRDTGLESERNNRVTAAQRLHLLNSSHIQRKIEQSRMLTFHLQGGKPVRQIARSMYLGLLSRYPSPAEIEAAEAYAASSPSRREAITDLAWALMNSSEFLFRH